MADVEFVYTKACERRILNSEECCEVVTGPAVQIAGTANSMFGASGYDVSPGRPGRARAHAIVYTGDRHSMNSNRLHNTLQKSIG